MRVKQFLSALVISFTPIIGFADMSAINNTPSFATAHVTFTCSSIAGDKGIIKPYSTFPIPQSVIDLYCIGKCNVDVYMSKNCSGKSIATMAVDQHKGVTGITNHNVDGYYLLGSGTTVSINRR